MARDVPAKSSTARLVAPGTRARITSPAGVSCGPSMANGSGCRAARMAAMSASEVRHSVMRVPSLCSADRFAGGGTWCSRWPQSRSQARPNLVALVSASNVGVGRLLEMGPDDGTASGGRGSRVPEAVGQKCGAVDALAALARNPLPRFSSLPQRAPPARP